ncbi:hypothetical protein DWW58_00430 [Olsenella sp. AF16-14LB]|jgi:hypothetical protein|uniref:DUF6591 domain-containing protein n=1 Tax=Tractidigestivibacter montrealensis TaxID=2972466 RepID=A0ABT1Z7W8_9ACTN|nr:MULTISPECIES: DUF6591 domain-containing protein [Atopobiaceae]MCR9036310.1 hypothetical protein [Tractidigestivibacter montrealensis]RGJ46402.1 hypothetical protein DXD59_05960 [Olsenella sp. TM06-36]RGS52567.1 hypothetical protein DWX86_03180 [Olsenella sp. AF21-51]RGU52429.1 hypothetical protein DWW58_00430 [Olsenella sp. AF16-14LB]RGU83671.1 hypothetical protein DWW44_00430 [Olsenella sp. AF15-43LB]
MEWEKANGAGGAGTSSGSGVPRGKKSGKGKIVLLVIIALIAIFMVSRIKGNSRDAKNSKLDWPTSGLATMLPEPGTDKGKVEINSDTAFSATLAEYSSSDYSSYVDACKEKGFTVDADQIGIGYAAFNEKGYKLSLTYYERKEELTVHLEAPDEMSTITWPTSGPGSLLPAPPSTQGSIVNDSSKLYQVNVGGMDKDAFSAYAAQCKEAGFDVDYSSGDTYYQAKNADGAKLRVDYKGANVVSIRVDVSDASSAESDAASSPASTDSSTTADSSIVTPEFKEMMDSYEEIMDKYCDFMVKYTGASAADQASMLADYTDLVQQEADWAQRISAVDESTLSDADDAYYIEVQARVSKRLIDAGVQIQQ